MQTIPHMILDRHARWSKNRCMMTKRGGAYVEITWDEYVKGASRLARSLIALGLEPGTQVAILSETRYEWAWADTAILWSGCVTVPIYPSLTAPEVADLVRRSQSRLVFVSNVEQAQKCMPLLDAGDELLRLVVFDAAALSELPPHPRLVSLEQLSAEGDGVTQAKLDERLAGLSPTAVATILFTSGTTGEPKGVMLTHRNILTNVANSLLEFEIGPDDLCLAHLPLAHILERMAGYYLMLWTGSTIAYAEDLKLVAQNISEVRPTLGVSVPRIFEKIHAGIQNKAMAAPAPVRALTFWALGVAARAGKYLSEGQPMPLGLTLQYTLADKLVFKKIRAKLGGRLRFFISGGAPLSPDLNRFFLAVGVHIYEGYGLTETSPVLNVNTPLHHRIGTVGRFIRGVEGKLDEDGEILVRGDNVFSSYFNNPEATRAAFTEDGFFRTGDIGEIDAEGYLKITDRKKDLIVTAGGKNVAPQKIENALKMDRYIADAMLFGDKRPFITALIVPDVEWLVRYAQHKGIEGANPKELVALPAIRDFYARRIAQVQKENHFSSHESVKKFVLLDHEFSALMGEVTPTLKVRRKILIEHYRKQLDALYAQEE